MPTYQYACTSESCGLNFERVQSFSDAAITECPQCNSRVRKVYGSVGVVFKGSGFYRTDSREAAGKGAKTSSDSQGSSSDKSSSSSSGSPADSGSAGSTTGSTSAKPAKSGSSETKSTAAKAS